MISGIFGGIKRQLPRENAAFFVQTMVKISKGMVIFRYCHKAS
jgi:hypothetical protein